MATFFLALIALLSTGLLQSLIDALVGAFGVA